MKKKRIAAVLAVMTLSALVIFISVFTNRDKLDELNGSYYRNLPPAGWEGDAMKGINPDFSMDKDFSSHLPIVVIDTDGMEPPIYAEMTEVDGSYIFTDIEGIDPYVSGRVEVICGNKENRIDDEPKHSSEIMIKRRGNSSILYEKAQYMLKLVTAKGEENKVDILGMGAENEWILNGSMADKSMIRNYVAYKTAAQFMPYTPDYEICEVVIKKNGKYFYNGVYLFGESIKQGKDRVDIQSFKANSPVNSFLVRRDRFDKNANILDTYATKNKLSKSETGMTYIELLYPGKMNATREVEAYAESEISTVEKVLYSDDFSVYSTYERYLDVDSFVDYYLINEFFGSYDSGTFSTYMYKDVGEKLKMGPVWDYDGTMDNYIYEPLEVEHMAFQLKPWFDRLVLDRSFVEKLESRYAYLRRTVLSDENITDLISETVDYIGPSQEREWSRWAHIYTTDNKYSMMGYLDEDMDYIHRNSREFQGEILRIKTILVKHGNEIQQSLNVLKGSCIWETDWNSRMDIALLVTMLIMAVSVIYIRRV